MAKKKPETTFKMPKDILDMPAQERVEKGGVALLKHLRRMPTQDELVQALTRDTEDGTSTGKGTVNKYWPSLQNEIAQELTLAEWLPAELPEFVIDHLKQLMDWARQDADAQLEEHKSTLNERERQLNEESESRKATEATLRDHVTELESSLKARDEAISQQHETQTSLKQALAEVQRTAAVQEEQLSHAAEREEVLSGKVEELKYQVRQSSESLKEIHLELQSRQKEIGLLDNQLQSLQLHHNEQLRLVSTLKHQITDLKEQLTKSEQTAKETKHALEDAQKAIQINETQLARQEGQLAVMDTLKSSVETLKDALGKEQERNLALEREKARLNKQLKQLERGLPMRNK
ncbi:MAG: DNA-binding protein [Pseudomonadales bacterium]|nr:DNA-binding protein [Pseudomonadales bacterium]